MYIYITVIIYICKKGEITFSIYVCVLLISLVFLILLLLPPPPPPPPTRRC